jgi:hypothetical protein
MRPNSWNLIQRAIPAVTQTPDMIAEQPSISRFIRFVFATCIRLKSDQLGFEPNSENAEL